MGSLFKLTNCMETAMRIQLMRLFQYIMTHVLSGKEQFAVDWYVCFAAFENSDKNFGRILQQSVSGRLALDDSAIDGHTQNGNIVYGEYRSEQVATPPQRYRLLMGIDIMGSPAGLSIADEYRCPVGTDGGSARET